MGALKRSYLDPPPVPEVADLPPGIRPEYRKGFAFLQHLRHTSPANNVQDFYGITVIDRLEAARAGFRRGSYEATRRKIDELDKAIKSGPQVRAFYTMGWLLRTAKDAGYTDLAVEVRAAIYRAAAPDIFRDEPGSYASTTCRRTTM